MRLFLSSLLALALLAAPGCGDKGSSSSSGSSEDGTSKPEAPAEGASAGKAAPAAAGGAETPEALVEEIKRLAESDDIAGMVPLTLPEHRALLSFTMGFMAPAMTIAMGEGMLGMAEMAGPEKAAEAKAKFEKTKTAFEALLEKHGIDMEPSGAMEEAQGMEKDPEGVIKRMNDAFAGVDHEAFIRDALAFMDEQKDGEDKGGGFKKSMPTEIESVEVDGDTAVVRAKGEDQPLHLVKKDGRWYIDFLALMKNR